MLVFISSTKGANKAPNKQNERLTLNIIYGGVL